LQQTGKNWTALVIGEEDYVMENIIGLKSGAISKYQKINFALDYIQNSQILPEYILRLDDDDIINPNILLHAEKLGNFDIYTDKWHCSWNYATNQIAQTVNYWFPNTCFIKTSHALSKWEPGNLDSNKYMLNNDHGNFHLFFKNKKVIFSPKKHPIYVRTISNSSIMANDADSQENYLKSFGLWRNIILKDYTLPKSNKRKPNLLDIFLDFGKNINYLRNYKKIVLK